MKKNSKLIYIINIIEILKKIVVAIPISIIIYKKFNIYIYIIYLGYILFVCFNIIIEYISIQYKTEDNTFIFKKGIFIKKEYEINKQKLSFINDIQSKQSFMNRLLNKYEIKIFMKGEDSSKLILKCISEKDKNEILSLFSLSNNYPENNPIIYRPNLREILITGFFSLNYFVVFFMFLDIKNFIEKITPKKFNILTLLQDSIKIKIIIFIFILSTVIIIQIIRYGNFYVKIKNDNIYINNGFFQTENRSFLIHNISSIIISDNLIMRLNKVKTVSISSFVSNDSESNTKNLLFPYINKDNLYNKIKNYFPNFIEHKSSYLLSEKMCKKIFFITNLIFFIILITITLLFNKINLILLIVAFTILIIMYTFIVSFSNNLRDNKRNIIIKKRGIFESKKIIIDKERIEIFKLKRMFFSKKYTLIIHTKSIPSMKYVIRGISKSNSNYIYKSIFKET